MNETLTLHFDGGSRGNPGDAGAGVVVLAADGTPLVTIGKYIGRATNNFAEYMALIFALREAEKLKATKLIVRGDSELVIKQMRGEYRVKNPGLRDLYEQAQTLVARFDEVKFEHKLRDDNALADRLANKAMDRKGDVDDDDLPPQSASAAPRSSSVP
jgi:ribonuclease HI